MEIVKLDNEKLQSFRHGWIQALGWLSEPRLSLVLCFSSAFLCLPELWALVSLEDGCSFCVEGKRVPGSLDPPFDREELKGRRNTLSLPAPLEGSDWPFQGQMTTLWTNPYGQSDGTL